MFDLNEILLDMIPVYPNNSSVFQSRGQNESRSTFNDSGDISFGLAPLLATLTSALTSADDHDEPITN